MTFAATKPRLNHINPACAEMVFAMTAGFPTNPPLPLVISAYACCPPPHCSNAGELVW